MEGRIMKKIYYIKTEEKDIITSVDDEDNVMYTMDDGSFPVNPGREQAEDFLRSIVYDECWNDDIDEGQLYDLLSTEDVLAEIEKDI